MQCPCRIPGFPFVAGARTIPSQEESERQNPAIESAAHTAAIAQSLRQTGSQSYSQIVRQISTQRTIDYRQYRLGAHKLSAVEEIVSTLTRDSGQLRCFWIKKVAKHRSYLSPFAVG